MVAAYAALPLVLYFSGLENPYFLQLAELTAAGALCVVAGARIGLFDRIATGVVWRARVDRDRFLLLVWGAFIGFVLIASATAERIPIVAALHGADPETIAVLRERFLKAREGWQSSFVYVNALLAGALVPYALALMMLHRHPRRWLCFGFFVLYCLSFVEKAFFLRAAIPLLYLVAQQRIRSVMRPELLLGGALALLTLATVASGLGGDSGGRDTDEFFSAHFVPQGPLAFLGWRAVAVPVVTAADALRVHEEEYGGRMLMGATSTVMAGAFGVQRVDVERDVFAAQWGQNETETGNANSVYLTEAFLNFGWYGVVAFSLLVGILLRVFATSHDEGLRSLWMLFCFGLFVAPLTGMLFSNGFLPVILLSGATSLMDPATHEASAPELGESVG
jgi:hypothetical protein